MLAIVSCHNTRMSFEIKCSTAAGEKSTSLVITWIGFPTAATYVKWTVDPAVCAHA